MRKRTITVIEEHPNLSEILAVLAQLPHVTDADLPRLAAAWHNTVAVADARAKALTADSPLVLEVLAAFEAVQALFAEDVAGEAEWCTLERDVVCTALKTIRDAIAAAYARPALSRGEYATLMAAWRSVYPEQRFDEPDLGPQGERVKGVLALLPMLSGRCHDPDASSAFDALNRIARALDADLHAQARDEAWRAAVLTSRRRVWGLVRRSGMEGLGRFCPRCRREPGGDEERLVLELCLDAACALLVADTVDDTLIEVLTLPLSDLIPAQRGSAG
jgi:hypothetical protein